MKEREIEPGTPEINKKYSIVVDRKGPYLVYGHPLLKQQFIVQNDEGSSWSYRDGIEYDMNDEPTALCRCGASANKPYCDGAHLNTNWDPTLTADNIPLLKINWNHHWYCWKTHRSVVAVPCSYGAGFRLTTRRA